MNIRLNWPRANQRSSRAGRSMEETSMKVGREPTNWILNAVASLREHSASSSLIWRSIVWIPASASIDVDHS